MSTVAGTSPEARIKLLVANCNVEIQQSMKIIRYLRTGKELLSAAETYLEEGDLEMSYILYMRFLTIFLEKLKDHPDFKSLGDDDRREIRSNCKRVLPVVEKIKKELLLRYQREYDNHVKEVKIKEEEDQKRQIKLKQEQSKYTPQAAPFRNSSAASNSVPSSQYHQQYSPTAPSVSTIKAVNYDYGGNCDPSVSNGSSKDGNIPAYPAFDRSSKPSRLVSPMGTDSLRTVVIPGDVLPKFISLASSNTLKNIETCGVLCGKIIRDQLVITHLVLPKQTGTPDSCTTLNEEEIYGINDKYSLIQMGWIHTHPSQTSFLSSVDLHTHVSYQLMMPESVAIVCAPSKQEYNVFTLTPSGMEALQKCADSGFHPHPQLDEPYFMDATHATFEPSRYIIVEDLRNR